MEGSLNKVLLSKECNTEVDLLRRFNNVGLKVIVTEITHLEIEWV